MAPLHETVQPYRAIFKMSGLAMSTTIGIAHRLREACDGHPHAKIEWPHRILHEAADEIERLRKALEWYAGEAEAAARYMAQGKSNAADALTAILTVLANDGGRRAREALSTLASHNKQVP